MLETIFTPIKRIDKYLLLVILSFPLNFSGSSQRIFQSNFIYLSTPNSLFPLDFPVKISYTFLISSTN